LKATSLGSLLDWIELSDDEPVGCPACV